MRRTIQNDLETIWPGGSLSMPMARHRSPRTLGWFEASLLLCGLLVFAGMAPMVMKMADGRALIDQQMVAMNAMPLDYSSMTPEQLGQIATAAGQ